MNSALSFSVLVLILSEDTIMTNNLLFDSEKYHTLFCKRYDTIGNAQDVCARQ